MRASELAAESPDVILFPEGIEALELKLACREHPESVIVAAVREGEHCRAIVCYGGKNHVSYLKVETDGLTTGTGDVTQLPIAHLKGVTLGVLICMDVDHPNFSERVFSTLRKSIEPIKLLCIPSDMGSQWFEGEMLQPSERYEGIYVALCNHTKTHDARCKSFITDTLGEKVQHQKNNEPIYAQLP